MQCFLLAQILSPLRAIAAAAACCSFPPASPFHTRTHIRLLYVCFPLPVTFCHRLPSPCVASRRSACAITSIINPFSFQMARHAQRDSHYHSTTTGCPFPSASLSLSLSSFRAAPLEPFRRRRQLAASVSPLFVFVFRLGHRLLLFAVCWPLCRTALRRTGQRHISTLSHSLCLPLAARPLGPSAQAAAGSVSFLRFARFTALPAALTDCIWQRLKIVVETSLLRRPFPAAAGLFIFVISLLRRSLNG